MIHDRLVRNLLLLTLLSCSCTGDDGSVRLTIRDKSRVDTGTKGFLGLALPDSTCRPLCYADPGSGDYIGIESFDHGRPCVRDYGSYGSVLKYLSSPTVGETVVLLGENRRVGLGVLRSVVDGEASYSRDGWRVTYRVTQGQNGTYCLSKHLYDAGGDGSLVHVKPRLSDAEIVLALREAVRARRIDVGMLSGMRLLDKVPMAIADRKLAWAVRAEARIETPARFVALRGQYESYLSWHGLPIARTADYDEAEYELDCDSLRYVMCGVVLDANPARVDWFIAGPNTSEVGRRSEDCLRWYCEQSDVRFVTPDDSVMPSCYEHYDSLVRLPDVDGDGTDELEVFWHGYESGGSLLLKKTGTKWHVEAGLSSYGD